jgi:hypothetical protein
MMQLNTLQATADRVEVEALRGTFTDAVRMHDYARLASLFTEDGAVRMPHSNAESVSREEIRAAAEVQVLTDATLAPHPAFLLGSAGLTPVE